MAKVIARISEMVGIDDIVIGSRGIKSERQKLLLDSPNPISLAEELTKVVKCRLIIFEYTRIKGKARKHFKSCATQTEKETSATANASEEVPNGSTVSSE